MIRRMATVEPAEPGARFIWTADLLPDELAPGVEAMISTAIAIIKKTLESRYGTGIA